MSTKIKPSTLTSAQTPMGKTPGYMPGFGNDFETEALPGTGVEPARFWEAMERTLREMAPTNAALLAKRDALLALTGASAA